MCSAHAERDVPFGRDVDFVSDVRFAREAEHITSLCAAGAIHHCASAQHHCGEAATSLFDSKVFQNFVDAFRAFSLCRQIRTGEIHFLIFTLRYATHRQAICILKTLRSFEMEYSPLDMPTEQADFWKQQLVLLQKLSFYHIRCLCVLGVKTPA